MRQNVNTAERHKISKPSQLLSSEENEQIVGLLGRKCQSVCTAVAQIFKTEASAHSHWKKKFTGVLCFVKDSSKRSYYIRMYCLLKNELVWEHEIYDNFKLNKARSFLLTFEGQDGHVALNFVSDNECDAFHRAIETTVENRNRKRLERRNRPKLQNAPSIPTAINSVNDDTQVTLRNHPKISSVQITPSLPIKQIQKTIGFKDKKKSQKYTKADISTPMNFIHISHVGWDAQKGFDLTGTEDDEILKYFFNKAGVSEQQLSDRETRAFIYDFIQSNNVLASVKIERSEKPRAPEPPPVPSRQTVQNGSQRVAPPPPPARQIPPPLPTTLPPSRAAQPPSRPPPITCINPAPSLMAQNVQRIVPTPPPMPVNEATKPSRKVVSDVFVPAPPPMPVNETMPPSSPTSKEDSKQSRKVVSDVFVPAPPPMPVNQVMPPTSQTSEEDSKPSRKVVSDDPRDALLESIRKGIVLKKVDQTNLNTGNADSRTELLSEIKRGIELRPIQNREVISEKNRTSNTEVGADTWADALRRALIERERVIHSSDEDSDDSSENDGEWDD